MTEDNVHAEEEQRLRECLSRIDEIISEEESTLGRSKANSPVFGEAAIEVRRISEDTIRNLRAARSSPYFGRVDFASDDDPDGSEPYYFGYFHIPLDYVYSWQSKAAKLFFDPTCGGYDCPQGRITGRVELKREITIRSSRLLHVTERRLLPPVPGSRKSIAAQPVLTGELAKPKSEGLQAIVPTIQAHQYEVIAAAPQRVMIIQGVAGSGKSEIGLHRIAYLLSPHNELNLNIAPNRVAFFGPSRAFLEYVSNLLPGLGVERVRQMTVRDWIRSTLSTGVRLESSDGLLERLLADTRSRLEIEVDLARWKVSMNMAALLDRHVKNLRKGFMNRATPLLEGHQMAMSKSRVKAILRGLPQQPLNVLRSLALSRLQDDLERRALTRAEGHLTSRLEAAFNEFWPRVDFKEAYARLLSDPAALLAASGGTLTQEAVARISGSMPADRRIFKMEDLPALCYLDHLLNDRIHIETRGQRELGFEHVVVDEAQDVSPLEYRLLYLHSSNKSFTLVGDIRQGLMAHRGISDWRELKAVFAREKPDRRDVNVSFRATYEITRYANRMLKTSAAGSTMAIPYDRHGEKPAFVRSRSHAEMVAAIAEDLRTMQAQGVQTMAVLCKTVREASKLQRDLLARGVAGAVLQDRPSGTRSQIVISPIHLARGLEYDAVVLANGRREMYTGSMIDNRLLYVAVTRAAHRLHVHWYGRLADALVDPTLLPKARRRTRRKKPARNESPD